MRGTKNVFIIAAIIAAGATTALGGDFNACREGVDQFDPVSPIPYDVTFRPYFSSKTPWTGTVEVVGEEGPGGEPRTINVANGEFTDNFLPEEVHIYKFARPSPYAVE